MASFVDAKNDAEALVSQAVQVRDQMSMLIGQPASADGHPAMGQHVTRLDAMLTAIDATRTRLTSHRNALALRFP